MYVRSTHAHSKTSRAKPCEQAQGWQRIEFGLGYSKSIPVLSKESPFHIHSISISGQVGPHLDRIESSIPDSIKPSLLKI